MLNILIRNLFATKFCTQDVARFYGWIAVHKLKTRNIRRATHAPSTRTGKVLNHNNNHAELILLRALFC